MVSWVLCSALQLSPEADFWLPIVPAWSLALAPELLLQPAESLCSESEPGKGVACQTTGSRMQHT